MSFKVTNHKADIVVGLALLTIGTICLPYLWSYSDEIAFAAVRAADEYAFMVTVERLLAPNLSIEYFKLFNSFSYGTLWWVILAITATPFKLLGSEQGMLVSIRLLSLISSLVGFYIAYKIVREITIRRLALFLSAIALIITCFFTQVVFINSTYIHPETMYCAFLMLSFQQLARTRGQINRNFYWSLVWLVVAASIKVLAVIFGVAYLVFWWLGPRNIGWKTVLKAGVTVFSTALLFNPWLLHPDLVRDTMAGIYLQSGVTRTGWPEDHLTWTFANSINVFSNLYVNFGSLLIVLSLALITMGFLLRRQVQWAECVQSIRLFFMSLTSIVAYAAFCLFYAVHPSHYGIAILYLFPVLIISMLDLLLSIGVKYGRVRVSDRKAHFFGAFVVTAAVSGYCWMQRDNLTRVYNLVTHPGEMPIELARHRAIHRIKDILERYTGAMEFVGVAHELAVPKINGQRISSWHFSALPRYLVGKSDILIFWKPDSAHPMKYIKRESTDPSAFDAYNQIREGGQFKIDYKLFIFKKFFEDEEFEIYKRTEMMTVSSASISHHHHAKRAFDGSTAPDDFWEAGGPFPHSITVFFQVEPPVISSYQFLVGEWEKRMPRVWQVKGSHDGRTWTILDERRRDKSWMPGETRTYLLSTPAPYSHYQFTFSEGFEANGIRIYEIRLRGTLKNTVFVTGVPK